MTTALKLTEARLRKQLTAYEMAEVSDLDWHDFKAIIQGRREPTAEEMLKLNATCGEGWNR